MKYKKYHFYYKGDEYKINLVEKDNLNESEYCDYLYLKEYNETVTDYKLKAFLNVSIWAACFISDLLFIHGLATQCFDTTFSYTLALCVAVLLSFMCIVHLSYILYLPESFADFESTFERRYVYTSISGTKQRKKFEKQHKDEIEKARAKKAAELVSLYNTLDNKKLSKEEKINRVSKILEDK